MIPRELIATAQVPDGPELRLFQRGGDFMDGQVPVHGSWLTLRCIKGVFWLWRVGQPLA